MSDLTPLRWLSERHVEVGGARISLVSIAIAAGILVVGFFLAPRLAARVRGAVGPDSIGAARWRSTAARITGHLVRVGAVAVALQVAGVDVATVLAAGAVVAVGIGIAMQKVAENFVSGVILMAERSIREGDIIEFDDRIARVRSVGIRATIAQTLDDEDIIVPNSILAQSAVKNLTLTDTICRLRVQVGVAYATDLAVAEKVLRDAAAGVSFRDQGHEPVVLLAGFGDSSVDFDVSVWTRDVWGMRRGQSALRMAIWQALQAADISIPFPQRDLHLIPAPAPRED